MTAVEKELLIDLTIALLAVLNPAAASSQVLTNRERARIIERRLEELRCADEQAS